MSQKTLTAVCTYCGSGPGNDPRFMELAHNWGEILATKKIRGVYGGGTNGLMGAFHTGVLSHGGTLTAVMPRSLFEREQPVVPHDSNSNARYRLIITTDMYARKATFRQESDAFVVLPGGAGTRDETWEEITALQIGDHTKPIVLVNYLDCFKHVLADIEQMRKDGFIRPGLEFDQYFAVVNEIENVLPALNRLLGITNVADLGAYRQAS